MVRDVLQIDVQVVLERQNITMVAVHDTGRHGIKQLGTLDCQGDCPGLLDH